jgi:hypothetical protein
VFRASALGLAAGGRKEAVLRVEGPPFSDCIEPPEGRKTESDRGDKASRSTWGRGIIF